MFSRKRKKQDRPVFVRVLFSGVPKAGTYFVGERNQSKESRDRWGPLRKGEVRAFNAELRIGRKVIGYLQIPKFWFGRKKKIMLRITAEFERLSDEKGGE